MHVRLLSVVMAAMFVASALLTGIVASASATAFPGFEDKAFYQNVTTFLVGAESIESFSTATASGPNGSLIAGEGHRDEGLCNCACWATNNFAYCQNTAKTTVGISTYWFDFLTSQWEARALRFFRRSSVGWQSGREATTFVERAVLPAGPGGRTFFEVSYVGDADPSAVASGGRQAEIVRGYTSGVSCVAHRLCDVQCAGVAMYEAWKKQCTMANATVSVSVTV